MWASLRLRGSNIIDHLPKANYRRLAPIIGLSIILTIGFFLSTYKDREGIVRNTLCSITGSANKLTVQTVQGCDPYSGPGYMNYTKKSASTSSFVSFDTDCQPNYPLLIDYIKAGQQFETLENKTMVVLGDSVDRRNVQYMCKLLKGKYTFTKQHSYMEPKDPDDHSGCTTTTCHFEKYNLTIASFFFYGLDEDDIWADKNYTHPGPGNVWERLEIAKSTIATLQRPVDLITLNVGFWELTRFKRLDAWAKQQTNQYYLREEQMREYEQRLDKFVKLVVSYFPETRIVYREMHETRGSLTSCAKNELECQFHPYKVNLINQAAHSIIDKNNLEYWPMGTILRGIPPDEYLADHIHPTETSSIYLWGNPMLEFLSRTVPVGTNNKFGNRFCSTNT